MPGPSEAEKPVGDCPPQQTLRDLALGKLPGDVAATIGAHAASCPDCSVLLMGVSETAAEAFQEKVEAPQPAQFVAEFRLIRPLGQGAMGQVFLAQDTFLDRPVAIKFLTSADSTAVARERFFIEARAVARLQHPNVVTLYRAGEEQGRRYLVSEYVDGKSLERWEKPLPWRQVLDIALGLSRGLAAAHLRGVLHRDIKPANTIVTEQGEVKILDFGLAKLVSDEPEAENSVPSDPGPSPGPAPSAVSWGQAEGLHPTPMSLTRSGTLLGTPLYMAPEAWRGKPATARTDVYSLGAMLYELCTGRPPHRADTVAALGARVASSNPKPVAVAAPSVDPRLAAVIDRCLQRDAAKRFASGEEVRQELERIAAKASFLSRRVAIGGLAVVVAVIAILIVGSVVREGRAKEQAKQQAALAQRLGQEIKDMEWLLRSARQLPLHDLNNEKAIVRKRMKQLEAELLSYGSVGPSLAHYALGRGHLALHEYPLALSELEQAMKLGYQSADAYYALGLVLGLHYKQAQAELRDMGPVFWVNKQLKPYAARYLTPAIAALKSSREMKHDAPQYLEGLIAFYQGDYDAALQHAQAAQAQAPWLYEASYLAGEVYFERSAFAEFRGQYDDAERALASAVRSFEAAAAIGQSDAEVYESLTAVWARRVSIARARGQPVGLIYESALAASDKCIRAEPDSILGRLKRTQATFNALLSLEGSTADLLAQCLSGTDEVLKKQPENLLAAHFKAACYQLASGVAELRGDNTEPLLRRAASLLEGIVGKDSNRISALSDLSRTYAYLAEALLSRGDPEAKAFMEKGLEYARKTAALEEESYVSRRWSLRIHILQISLAASEQELQSILAQADTDFATIQKRNQHDVGAYKWYVWAYVTAAYRTYLAGQDPTARLAHARDVLAQARKLENDNPEQEEDALLIQYVDASSRLRARQDPEPALVEAEAALQRCLAMAANDAQCQTFGAQADWVRSEWLAQQKQPAVPALRRALQRATAATQSPEQMVEAWQVLAETRLRLALSANTPAENRLHLTEGLAAVQKVFAINPNYALGLATQGALLLARAQGDRDPARQQSLAREAATALERGLKSDSLLRHQYGTTLETARALARPAAP